MKKLVFLSLLSVALLTSCGNGAQKDALKAQNDSLMVELSNRNALYGNFPQNNGISIR